MEFFFLKLELRNRIVKRLEKKIKINDWIAMILGISGTLIAVIAVSFPVFISLNRAIFTKCQQAILVLWNLKLISVSE